MATVEKRRQSADLSNLVQPELNPQDWEDFERGIVLFNSGKYWESHEAWEEVWKRHPENSRIFFQGLIQVAAALHQLQRQIYHGTEKHFRNALWKLKPFQPETLGIDVTQLVTAMVKCQAELSSKKLEQFDKRLIPTISKINR
ncbi:MAG: DUF309 domain-containing protein [bacterium]